jgi:hypothetical protein
VIFSPRRRFSRSNLLAGDRFARISEEGIFISSPKSAAQRVLDALKRTLSEIRLEPVLTAVVESQEQVHNGSHPTSNSAIIKVVGER